MAGTVYDLHRYGPSLFQAIAQTWQGFLSFPNKILFCTSYSMEYLMDLKSEQNFERAQNYAKIKKYTEFV